MNRLLRRLLAVALLLYLGVCGYMYLAQGRLTFPGSGPAERPAPPASIVAVPEGTLMLWMPPPSAQATVVVHFHGNGGQVAREQWLGERLAERGAGFAAVEYPGYGLASGEASEPSVLEASRAALRVLTGQLGVPPGQIALSGHSMGTGVATAMAAEGWGARLLLVSPYTSLVAVASSQYPWLPVGLLMKAHLDSLAAAPKVQQPVLILHGEVDRLIPISHGEALAAAFPHATLKRLPGVGHPDVWEQPEAKPTALAFLAP